MIGHVRALRLQATRRFFPWSSTGCIWYFATPPVGNVDTAVVDVTRNDWESWDSFNATPESNTYDTLDPEGGTSAGKLIESSGNEEQLVYVARDAGVQQGPVEVSAYFKPGTGNYGLLATVEDLDHSSAWNLTTGEVIRAGVDNYDHFWRPAANGWAQGGYFTDYPDSWVEVGVSDASGNIAYQGTGKHIYVWRHRQYQLRVGKLYDVQPVFTYELGKTGPFDLNETAPSSHPFYRWYRGRNEIWTPRSQSKTLKTTAAELVAFLDGSDKPFSMLLAGRSDVAPPAAHHGAEFFGASHYHRFGWNTATNWWSSRYDGTTTSTKTGGTPGTDEHVVLLTFDGAVSTLYDETLTPVWTASGQDVNALALTTFALSLCQGALFECIGWCQALPTDHSIAQVAAARRRLGI